MHGLWPLECCDTELAWRMKGRGYTTVYRGDVIVYHEIMQVDPWNWVLHHARFAVVPVLVRRFPGLRKKLLWWGPFALADNVRFYFAAIGVVFAWMTRGWSLLLAAPFVWRSALVPGKAFSPARLPLMAGRVFFFGLRQVVIFGSLV